MAENATKSIASCDASQEHCGAGPLAVQRVTLTGRNLGYAINGTTILRGINLVVEPGEILAVVGPSGAGKSTLLNCLSFRTKRGARTGVVEFNGEPATARDMRNLCNYVMTDGRMLPYLTVFETLMVAAKLKLPLLTQQERADRVEQVIKDLGLQNCRETYIGGEWKKGISTGEKKRVCIAAELLANPSILLLDEPTNGLDSTLACELYGILQRLAAAGRTIVLSIHQPSSQVWNMLDQLLLISHGQTVYFGNARMAKEYFAQHNFPCPKNFNPADYFLCLISDDPSAPPSSRSDASPDTSSVNTIASSAPSGDLTVDNGPPASSLPELEAPASYSGMPVVPPRTIERLIATFDTSRENDVLKKRIDVVVRTATSFEDTHHTGGKRNKILYTTPKRRWCYEMRSFLNSIRNPIVCCIMLLVQALQGIILGGIFWQLTADVARQKPFQISTNDIIQNPWAQLFMHGIDGRQPLLEFLEQGVDNHGSQPVLAFLNDTAFLVSGYNIVKCGLAGIGTLNPYPRFGVRPITRTPDIETLRDATPEGVAGSLIGLMQSLDHLYLHYNWTELFPNGKPLESQEFYLRFLLTPGKVIISPYMECAGYPRYPGSRRRLITIGDIGVADALTSFLGIGGKQMIEATKEIFHRARSCDKYWCRWIDEKATYTYDVGNQAYTASMATINVLGALFFAVANLGFSSYDALLTFPQERLLFNRESANGLYSTSSYFIAKNLADLPFQLLPNFVLATIYYFMIGLGGTVEQYVVYFLVCAGITFAAYGFGYLVSAASPRMEIAVLAAPVVLVIWLTIAGFFLRDAQIPAWISWFTYFSFYKWGFFSLVSNQFPAGGYFGVLPNHIPIIMAGITETRVWVTGLLLLALGLLYRVLAFLALKYTNRSVGIAN